jgi:hypothetical protein
MMSYTYHSKLYNVVINGQTGEVQGQSPKSAIKIIAAVLLGIAIVATIYYFIG